MTLTTADHGGSGRWSSAWPDALAFAAGLALAWWSHWTATDLVWSLWLSSLVVGYSIIVWTIVRPGLAIARGAWRDRVLLRTSLSGGGGASVTTLGAVMLLGGAFLLAFFTVHFGMFHYVHSQFLAMFLPLDPASDAARRGLAGASLYGEVVRRYWHFLPMAFLAERGAFQRSAAPRAAADVSVTASAIAARKAANARGFGDATMAPYRNVARMHVLIFFFAFAHFVRLDGFLVYAVVYAAYFFPWRLLRRAPPVTAAAAASPNA